MSDLSPMDKAAERLIACQYDAAGFSTDGCSQVMDGLFVAKEYRRLRQELTNLKALLSESKGEIIRLQKALDNNLGIEARANLVAMMIEDSSSIDLETVATEADETITVEWLLANEFLQDGDDDSKAYGLTIWEKGVDESFGEEPGFQLLVENGSVWLEAYGDRDNSIQTLALIELPIETRSQLVRLINALNGEK